MFDPHTVSGCGVLGFGVCVCTWRWGTCSGLETSGGGLEELVEGSHELGVVAVVERLCGDAFPLWPFFL